ncbi:methyltransferase type 11 [bacterium DOLZORAL124_64_63]|nr:MAG: methyltransferase type 11 [bacterium DOLZORAL124_64_63]
MKTPRELQALYDQGHNITRLLRAERGLDHNTADIIEMAYDLQTGSYIQGMSDPKYADHKQEYTAEVARTILSLCEPDSVMEAGVGEGTTLAGVLRNLPAGIRAHGFDLSWSRAAFARRYLEKQKIRLATLCTGNLFAIPYADSSIDVVYTSHTIEPNGGQEKTLIQELYRVARRYLVLLEPGYELASPEARRHMRSHGYCRGIKAAAQELGYRILRHQLFPHTANPLNPTALTIIEKNADTEMPDEVLACPRFKTPLEKLGGLYFSPEALVVYPVVGGIPCLRIENGILASKYREIEDGGTFTAGPRDGGLG